MYIENIVQKLRQELYCRVSVIELSGDQRPNIKNYLVDHQLASKDEIIIHGY
jgi:translation initiation factor 1 (eIF-1/SUI1)